MRFIKCSYVYMPQFLPFTRSPLFRDQLQNSHRNIHCKELLFFSSVFEHNELVVNSRHEFTVLAI